MRFGSAIVGGLLSNQIIEDFVEIRDELASHASKYENGFSDIEEFTNQVTEDIKTLEEELGPRQNYDAGVQAVLDQYWSGYTLDSRLKYGPQTKVYTAKKEGVEEEVIVKSVAYTEELEQDWDLYMNFVNFLSNSVSVASYIEPGVEHSDDMKKLISVSTFAQGERPEDVFGFEFAWCTNEKIAKEIGRYMGQKQVATQQYRAERTENYDRFPSWDSFEWQTNFRKPTIPVTPENYGLVHGDLHTGNFMLQERDDGEWDMTVLDFDLTQQSWFMVDLGSIVFNANVNMYHKVTSGILSKEAQEFYIDQFKDWVCSAYGEVTGTPVDRDYLTQGCQWRQDFYYTYFKGEVDRASKLPFPNLVPGYEDAVWWVENYESGAMPSC